MPTDPADFERKIRCHEAMPFVFCCAAAGVVGSMWFGYSPVAQFSGLGIGLVVGLVIAAVVLTIRENNREPESPAEALEWLRDHERRREQRKRRHELRRAKRRRLDP